MPDGITLKVTIKKKQTEPNDVCLANLKEGVLYLAKYWETYGHTPESGPPSIFWRGNTYEARLGETKNVLENNAYILRDPIEIESVDVDLKGLE